MTQTPRAASALTQDTNSMDGSASFAEQARACERYLGPVKMSSARRSLRQKTFDRLCDDEIRLQSLDIAGTNDISPVIGIIFTGGAL